MQKQSIQRFLPYEADYDRLGICRKIETIGLWIISICSVALPVLDYFSENVAVNGIYTQLTFFTF